MPTPCDHVGGKVYGPALLLSDPPRRPWVCRRCLAEGADVSGPLSPSESEYDRLLRRKRSGDGTRDLLE